MSIRKSERDHPEHAAFLDAQELVTQCARCAWTYEGTAAAGREAYAEHRRAAHRQDRVAEGKRWDRARILEAAKAWTKAHGQPPTSTQWIKEADDHPSVARVVTVFTKWSNMIREASLSNVPTNGHTDPRTVEEAVASPWLEKKITDHQPTTATEVVLLEELTRERSAPPGLRKMLLSDLAKSVEALELEIKLLQARRQEYVDELKARLK